MALTFKRMVLGDSPCDAYTGHVCQGIRLANGGFTQLMIQNQTDKGAGFCVYEWDASIKDFAKYPIQVNGKYLAGATLRDTVPLATAYINRKYNLHF